MLVFICRFYSFPWSYEEAVFILLYQKFEINEFESMNERLLTQIVEPKLGMVTLTPDFYEHVIKRI